MHMHVILIAYYQDKCEAIYGPAIAWYSVSIISNNAVAKPIVLHKAEAKLSRR